MKGGTSMGYLVMIFGWLPVLSLIILGCYWVDKSDKLCEINRQEKYL